MVRTTQLLVVLVLLIAACTPVESRPAAQPTLAPTAAQPATTTPAAPPSPGAVEEPTPAEKAGPTPAASATPASVTPVGALEAALAFVSQQYADQDPPATLSAAGQEMTEPGLLGRSTLSFSRDSWRAVVSYPLVLPEPTTYTITLDDYLSGFHWEGTVEAQGQISEETVILPEATPTAGPGSVEAAAIGTGEWLTFVNPIHGYAVDYPAELKIESDDLSWAVTFVGPLVDNDWWPVLGVGHPPNTMHRPPADVDLRTWLLDNNLLHDGEPGDELTLAGLPAIHRNTPRSPQSYALDEYFVVHGGQLFRLTLLHTTDRQDWTLYRRFLNSFRFVDPPYGERVEGWQGVVSLHHAAVQNPLILDLDDGRGYVISGSSAEVQTALEAAAWQGEKVAVWGVETPLSGLLKIEQVEVLGPGQGEQARDLTPFAQASASSALPADRLGSNQAWAVADGRPEQPWCEGAAGPGLGEWVQLDLPGEVEITRLEVSVGYDSSADLFSKNHRLKSARLILDDGQEIPWTFADRQGLQDVALACAPGPCNVTSTLRLVIEEIYPGTTYDDTCIGEIQVWGRPQ